MKGTAKQRAKYLLADFITANIAIFLFDVARFYTLHRDTVGFTSLEGFLSFKPLIVEQMLLPLMMIGIYAVSGFYNNPFQKSRLQEFFATALNSGVNTVLVYFALLTNQLTSVRSTNYEMLLYLFCVTCGLTYIGRWIITSITAHGFRSGHRLYNVLVAGQPDAARHTAEGIRMHSRRTGLNMFGYINLSDNDNNSFGKEWPVFQLDSMTEVSKENNIREIIVASKGMDEHAILRLIYKLFPLGVPIKITPESLSALNSNIRLQSIYEEPYIDASTANVSEFTKNVKRIFDVVVSAIALILLSVPMAVIAILVKRDSPGKIIFSQERIGYRQRPFQIYKFRTMRPDAEADGPRLSNENDPRITRIGQFLRKYRLDELPQFWNVLRGDMSLVGPRPERRYFITQIMEQAPCYSLVHQVRPGITSWGMVKYGYASEISQMVKRLRYDLVYLANMSVTVDLKILIYTVKTVLKGRGK